MGRSDCGLKPAPAPYTRAAGLISSARLKMNKLLLICLLGAALVALSGADVSNEEQSVADISQVREVRAADPGKGKGKGKGRGLKKKDKKKRKNLKKSDKKSAGKKNGDKKKKGKKNGAKRSKKDGKGKKRKNGAKKNGKKQKGLKKKSRKNKSKDGKGKNKDRKKKKARKAAKKEDKKDEKKKAKKEKKKARKAKKKARKQKKSNRKAKGTVTARSSCMNATCIDNAVTYMKQLKLAVKNFDKQYNRITVKSKQTSGKSDKNDEFAPYLIKLSETGGGNVSNLSCNGEYNTGATNLQTLYDNIASCETKINDSCNANMPAVNQTFMDACKATMDLFVNKTSDAIDFNLKGNGADACKIWESSEVAAASAMLKDCGLKSTEKEYTAASKSCLKSFSWCRQEEDKVSKLVAACSSFNSADKATAAIAQGVTNNVAATALSAKVNSTLAGRSGYSRSSANLSCGDFATEVTSVSTQVAGSPLLASLETMLTTLVNATVAACTDDEKTSLGTASTTFLESKESIAVAIAEKNSALNISTGTTVAVPTVAASVTTVAATAVNTTTGAAGNTTEAAATTAATT